MLGNFDIPSVDHLREGIDYKVLSWDFAAGRPAAPVPHTPGEPCPPGTRMTFGLCRRLKGGTGDWDPSDESDMERAGKMEAQKQGSTFETNKPVTVGDKKYGWAKKNGVPVLVEWGSVAGTKPKAAPASPTGASAQTPLVKSQTPKKQNPTPAEPSQSVIWA